jgi:hypothetical protein
MGFVGQWGTEPLACACAPSLIHRGGLIRFVKVVRSIARSGMEWVVDGQTHPGAFCVAVHSCVEWGVRV